MARNPRPIDPAQGPLQAFAVELRRLREAAGNPTYRAMSARAGFSATTLSEAAGGVRKPSLDVTLAYVEVCDGEQAEWRSRWERMDRALAAKAGPGGAASDSASTAAPDEYGDQEVSGVGDGAPPPTQQLARPSADDDAGPDATERARRWKRGARNSSSRGPLRKTRPSILLVIVALAVVGTALATARLAGTPGRATAAAPSGKPSVSGAQACPSTNSNEAVFSGQTYVQGTNERAGANLDSPEVRRLPAQCELSFSGYCLGQSLRDQRSGSPDMRWFKLADGSGVVASAIIHGNPPPNLSPSECPNDAPPPAVVQLHIAAAPGARGTEMLSASGIDAPIVGYAAYYSERQEADIQAPAWHEIALNDRSYEPQPEWHLADVSAAISSLTGTPAGTVPVIAVACYGGGAPTQIFDAAAIRLAAPEQTMAVQLTPPDLAQAERAACAYPATG